ncbi:hypothetical protein VNO78_25018 [Psophocarpus tetragonolobus]|uniref:Uncharacterized protein n=1 Tax=Psophocarpus tetragonolobus TaxID=3891 RepID=A0AAN9XEW6_PSOTE
MYGQVRKEKLGDRVTALQQLVSPFEKSATSKGLVSQHHDCRQSTWPQGSCIETLEMWRTLMMSSHCAVNDVVTCIVAAYEFLHSSCAAMSLADSLAPSPALAIM